MSPFSISHIECGVQNAMVLHTRFDNLNLEKGVFMKIYIST